MKRLITAFIAIVGDFRAGAKFARDEMEKTQQEVL
jgi:hypothetical protein